MFALRREIRSRKREVENQFLALRSAKAEEREKKTRFRISPFERPRIDRGVAGASGDYYEGKDTRAFRFLHDI